MMSDHANANDALAAADFAAPDASDTPDSAPAASDSAANDPLPPGYAVASGDNITLMASKIIRDVLVTPRPLHQPGRPLAGRGNGYGRPLPRCGRGPEKGLVQQPQHRPRPVGHHRSRRRRLLPLHRPGQRRHLASVVDYLRICRGEAPYIGDVGDFIKICRPGTELDAARLLQSSRALE